MNLEKIIQAAFEHSNEAIMVTDAAGAIIDVNPSFSNLYGFSKNEALGKTPRIIKSDFTTKEQHYKMWKEILDPKIGYWKGELTNRSRDGRIIPVLLHISPITDDSGKISNYVGLTLDLTEKKKLEAENNEKMLKLSYIGENATTIIHDLRNPITSIHGFAQMAMDDPNCEPMRKYFEPILRNSKRILGISNEILDIAKGEIVPDYYQVHMADFIDNLVVDFSEQGYSQGISLSKDVGYSGEAYFDEHRIQRVMWNLMKNSAEAMEKNAGERKIKISSMEKGESLILGVHDNGPGLPPGLESRLFSYGATGKDQGNGIGLFFSKKMVDAHGGEVSYKRKGDTSSFYVYLPKRPHMLANYKVR